VFGVSKQAYYQRIKSNQKRNSKHQIILDLVLKIRKIHPRAGVRKLMEYLQADLLLQKIKLGRDELFTLLRNHGLLVKKTKRFHITTDSKHFFFKSPNPLKDTDITHAEQALVTDITYIKTDEGHAYLALATDPYSKKIMGYHLDNNMKVDLVKKALKMAHQNKQFKIKNTIHHSDRDIQYCCPDYAEYAERLGYKLSTTQQYDPYENPIAERINGILKYEYGLKRTLPNLFTAQKMAAQAIEIYNHERIHWSLGFKTPQQVHEAFDQHRYKSYVKVKSCA
jgi:putative transposase